jgi:AbiU2
MTAQTVRDIAAEAFADAIDVLSIIETLEAGNAPAAVAVVNAARTDAVAQCVFRALWSRLVVIVTRAYANARPGDRHAQYAFDLLKDPAVRSEVEKMGNPATLAEAIALWAKCRDDHRRQSIDEFRNNQIAHWGSLKNPAPIINDIFAVSRATAAALERLAQGTGVVTLSLDSQLMGYRDKADRFWK